MALELQSLLCTCKNSTKCSKISILTLSRIAKRSIMHFKVDKEFDLFLHWHPHITDTFEANLIVRSREVSAARRCHPLTYGILGRKYLSFVWRCPLYRGIS